MWIQLKSSFIFYEKTITYKPCLWNQFAGVLKVLVISFLSSFIYGLFYFLTNLSSKCPLYHIYMSLLYSCKRFLGQRKKWNFFLQVCCHISLSLFLHNLSVIYGKIVFLFIFTVHPSSAKSFSFRFTIINSYTKCIIVQNSKNWNSFHWKKEWDYF